jgi:predicted nucleotidyltransferase
VIPNLQIGREFLAAHGPSGRLLVGVTGAHYYGFPSPDSDLDLKGIHVAPTREIVSLRPPADTIDYLGVFQGLEIDYTSHELALALRLLLRGNGNILERILSPMQLVENPEVAELRAIAQASVSKKFFHHYRGFFGRMCQEWRKAEPRTVKGVLYAYRSALTGIHLLLAGECVGDVTRLAHTYSFPAVEGLVAQKVAGTEHGVFFDSNLFEGDLARLETRLQDALSLSKLPEEADVADTMNDFLVRKRRARFDEPV